MQLWTQQLKEAEKFMEFKTYDGDRSYNCVVDSTVADFSSWRLAGRRAVKTTS